MSGTSRQKLICQKIFDEILIELLIFLVSDFFRFRNYFKKTEEEFGHFDKELFYVGHAKKVHILKQCLFMIVISCYLKRERTIKTSFSILEEVLSICFEFYDLIYWRGCQ